VLLRFDRWEDLLALDVPPATQPVSHAYFQYARGVALAALGRPEEAKTARAALATATGALPPGSAFRGNGAAHIMAIAAHVLDARIAIAERRAQDAVPALAMAVALQDGLRYEEPASWDFPVRELLGTAWLQAGNARAAEAAFRDGLIRFPRHPRLLAGLRDALAAQDRDDEAALVDAQFRRGWAGAP
jgi:hypothetical protein